METIALDIKSLKRNRSMMNNMFSFLTQTKKLSNIKLIDITAKTKKEDTVDYIESFIIQGTHKDRLEKEFTFQIHIDPLRLKGDTAQPQVYILFQHKKDSTIKLDVDTNGQLFDTITQYIHSEKDEKFTFYKSQKEETIEEKAEKV